MVQSKGLGQKYVAVVGIDRYRAWPSLGNAVRDARGALNAFNQLGFKQACPPLLDEAATYASIHRLVTDQLSTLGTDDSLVIFFAGHGHNVTTTFDDGTLTKTGYLIPVDAETAGEQTCTWLSLDSWLQSITKLPPRHILVILDACHSGVALDPVIRWRGEDVRLSEPLETLRTRRSRRIITSALDDQLAMDSGPVVGHSLFTGCLIEALTGGLVEKTGQTRTTGSELGLHVQQRVTMYPSSKQTPDFGALQLDNRGELIIDLPAPYAPHDAHGAGRIYNKERTSGTSPPSPRGRPGDVAPKAGVDLIRSKSAPPTSQTPGQTAVLQPKAAASARPPTEPREASVSAPAGSHVVRSPSSRVGAPERRPSSPLLEAAFIAALDRHDAVRARKGTVLTVVAADPMTALAGWGTWAAARGQLTLATDATGLSATIDALLAQMPWLRALRAARARLATAAGISPSAVDTALDARSAAARTSWIDDVSRHDLHARVSGWLLSALREPWAQVPDLKAAPVQGGDLLSILCDLATPVAVLLHHADPSPAWIEHAIQTASELVEFLPGQALAIGAPAELVARAVRSHPDSAALSLARQGIVPLASRAQRVQDQPSERAEQLLHTALAADPRTSGLFELNVQVPVHDRAQALEVDLVARDALLAIEIDDWFHYRDPQAYHRDRIKDVWLQRAGFFVMRFLVDDVEERLQQTVDEIALGLAGRRASGSFLEKAQ
jgi:very-short-patch-repair endonuclease